MAVTAEQVAQELQALRQELLESRRREDELNNRLQAMQAGGHGLQEAMTSLAEIQREVLERARSRDDRVTLVDNKGLAKPEKFGRAGSEHQFLQWKVRFETFVLSIHKDLEQALSYAEDSEDVLNGTRLKALFGPVSPGVVHVPHLEEKDAQLHAALQTLCEGEAFTLVRSAGRGAGLEAWRKLHRRYDPSTGGRRRALLRQVLTPQKCSKVEELSSSIELWEEAVRQFEQRRRPDGSRAQLDDDIKIAVLEAMCPPDLEKHLQLSRHRLSTYEEVRAELSNYLETRAGTKVQLRLPGASRDDSGPVPMDVGAFEKKGKGKGKDGKGKGKGGKAAGGKDQRETRECHNCGKVGHLARDCWAPKKDKKGGGGKPEKKKEGKGKEKKGKGKGGKSLHNVEEGENEPEEESEEPEANFLAIAGLTEVSLSESEDEGLHDTSRPYRPAVVEEARVKQEAGESSHEPKAAGSQENQGPSEGVSGAVGSADPGPAEAKKEEEEEVKEEEEEESSESSSYVEVLLYPGDPGYDSLGDDGEESEGDYVEVCVEPCGYCYSEECDQTHDDEFRHVCSTCRLAKMSADHRSRVLLWTPLEAFEFSVDKTICVVKGLTLEQFKELTEGQKNAYRDAVDPEQVKRINQDDVLKGLSRFREAERKSFFKKAGHPGEDPSQASGQAGVRVSRPAGRGTCLRGLAAQRREPCMMHRTIEMLEITNLGVEKREKAQQLEIEEDPEEAKRLEARIREIDEEVKVLKERTKAADREATARPKLTEETVLDQSWHDARYHRARQAGVSHSQAWTEEKKRRRATLHRQQGTAERAKERLENERKWHREFDSRPVKEEEYHDEAAPGLETEAVEETEPGKLRVLTGSVKQVKRGELKKDEEATFVASARTYRKLSQAEVSRFRTETRERKRVDLQKKRTREMTEEKKEARKKRVKAASRRKEACRNLLWFGECTRARCPFGHDPELVKKAKFSVCSEFSRGVCGRKQCRFVHDELEREKYQLLRRHRQRQRDASEAGGHAGVVLREAPGVVLKEAPEEEQAKEEPVDLCHLSNAGGSAESWEGYKKVTVNFDTGAAISAIPVAVAQAATRKTAASEKCYRTASGEVIEDQGGAPVQGYDAAGVGRKIEGRVTDVHRMLASGAAVGKHNHVLLMGSKGYVMPKGGRIAKALEKTFREELKAGRGKDVLEMEERRGIYVFDLWVKESKETDCVAVGALGRGKKETANSRQARKP